MKIMKQLTDINLARMSNGAHFAFVERVLTRAKADTKAMAVVGKFVTALETAFAEEDKYLTLSRKSMKTDSIAKADAERDRLYRGVRKAVKAFMDTGVARFATPASVLWQSMKDYNINTSAQIDKETGLLTNLIDDFQGVHADCVEALALTDLVALMKTANEEVKTLTKERIDDRLGVATGALKAARNNTDDAYRTLTMAVNGYVVLNGDSELGALIDVLNLEIQHYKREVLGGKAGAPDTSAPDGGTGTETPGGDTDKPGGGTDKPGGNEPGTGGGDGDGGTSFD